MALKLITPPAETPISLTYVKDKLRVDHTDDDDMLEAFILANTQFCDGPDGFLKRALITQTWELTLDEFPDEAIQIPLSPLQEVVSIKYDDVAGDEQTIDTNTYYVDNVSEPGWVVPASSWPTPLESVNVVRVRFIAGYLDDGASPPVENVPADIKLAILLRVKADYEGGEIAERLRSAAETVLRQKRLHVSMA